MLYRREDQQHELVHRLARQAVRLRGKSRGRAVERFVSQFYDHVAPEDMLSIPEDALLGAALSAWDFLDTRRARKPKIRVFNPTQEKHGWYSKYTVVEIVNDDMPFLVDSVTAELNRHNLTVHLTIHPVMRVRRDKNGRITKLYEPGEEDDGAIAESVMHLEVNEQNVPETRRLIRNGLTEVLGDVRASVEHWRAMRVRVADAIAELDSTPPPLPVEEIEETKAFLRWIEDNHFAFMGYREYGFNGSIDRPRLTIRPRTGHGILRKASVTLFEGL